MDFDTKVCLSIWNLEVFFKDKSRIWIPNAESDINEKKKIQTFVISLYLLYYAFHFYNF